MPKNISPRHRLSTTDHLRRRRPITPHSRDDGREPPSHLIVIGASSGGHAAVKEVLRGLSSDLPAAVVLTLHMPAARTNYGGGQYGDWFQNFTQLPIRLIEPQSTLQTGVVYVVPPGMTATLHQGKFQIAPYAEKGGLTSIDALFQSAASEYGNRVIGVVLSGRLKDGTAGLRAIHEAGGLTLVQNPATAEFADMPGSAMADLPVTFCLNGAQIGLALDLLVRRKAGLETGLAVSVRLLKERVALLVALQTQSHRNPETLKYVTTELKLLERYVDSIEKLLHKDKQASTLLMSEP